MSILIRGMEMPKSCTDCPFKGFDKGGRGNICTINDSITLHAVLDGTDIKFVRMGDCPLVPVPPHGRPIDADEAVNDMPTAQEWMPITSRPMTEDERQEWSEKLGSKIDDDEAVIYGNLPDNGQRVLVYHKYSREIEIDTFFDDDEGCYFEKNGDMDGITHWMPLPEKPKEEEK